MKVVAFNGSARKDGNTAILINNVLQELEKEGIGTELIQLAGEKIRGCVACMKCWENKDQRCSVTNDVLNSCIEKMVEADGIILGSPTYFANISTEMKALIDRAGMTSIANDRMFKLKVGAAVVAVRRAGSIHAFNSINHFFFIGIQTMKILGENMAWLLKKLNG
jgi:multimeric flavodoxin WrbA